MTALYIGPNVPVVDPQTGLCAPIWYRLFTDLFKNINTGGVDDAEAFLLYPNSGSDSVSALLNQGGGDLLPVAVVAAPADDDVSPVSFQTVSAPDDLAPVPDYIGMIANLQAQIDDLRKGTFS